MRGVCRLILHAHEEIWNGIGLSLENGAVGRPRTDPVIAATIDIERRYTKIYEQLAIDLDVNQDDENEVNEPKMRRTYEVVSNSAWAHVIDSPSYSHWTCTSQFRLRRHTTSILSVTPHDNGPS